MQYHFIPDNHGNKEYGDFELFLEKYLEMYEKDKKLNVYIESTYNDDSIKTYNNKNTLRLSKYILGKYNSPNIKVHNVDIRKKIISGKPVIINTAYELTQEFIKIKKLLRKSITSKLKNQIKYSNLSIIEIINNYVKKIKSVWTIERDFYYKEHLLYMKHCCKKFYGEEFDKNLSNGNNVTKIELEKLDFEIRNKIVNFTIGKYKNLDIVAQVSNIDYVKENSTRHEIFKYFKTLLKSHDDIAQASLLVMDAYALTKIFQSKNKHNLIIAGMWHTENYKDFIKSLVLFRENSLV